MELSDNPGPAQPYSPHDWQKIGTGEIKSDEVDVERLVATMKMVNNESLNNHNLAKQFQELLTVLLMRQGGAVSIHQAEFERMPKDTSMNLGRDANGNVSVRLVQPKPPIQLATQIPHFKPQSPSRHAERVLKLFGNGK